MAVDQAQSPVSIREIPSGGPPRLPPSPGRY